MAIDTRKVLKKVTERTLDLAFRYDQDDLDRVSDAQRWANWDWYMGVAFYGLWKAHELLENDAYILRIKQWIDQRIETGIQTVCVNTCAPMTTVLRLHQLYPEERYETLCQTFDDYILNQAPWTPSGAMAHTVIGQDFVGQVWADTLFMSIIYLTQRGLYLHSRAHLEEAARQRVLHLDSLYDEKDGLFYHGWDDVAKKPLGVKWGRGNAWIIVSMMEMLESIPLDAPERTAHLEKLNSQMAALEEHQDSNGYWRTVLDHHDTYPETSVTAGVAAGALKGIRLGLIDDKYQEMALKAIQALVAKIDDEGNVVGGSSGTAIKENVAEYNAVPLAVTPFTQGLALMALCEATTFASLSAGLAGAPIKHTTRGGEK
jgi:unsaturated rhamnogalacturonyl hydrolase